MIFWSPRVKLLPQELLIFKPTRLWRLPIHESFPKSLSSRLLIHCPSLGLSLLLICLAVSPFHRIHDFVVRYHDGYMKQLQFLPHRWREKMQEWGENVGANCEQVGLSNAVLKSSRMCGRQSDALHVFLNILEKLGVVELSKWHDLIVRRPLEAKQLFIPRSVPIRSSHANRPFSKARYSKNTHHAPHRVPRYPSF